MHVSNMDAPQVCSLVDTGPARPPSHSALTGRLVCIEPLSPSHIEGLYDSVGRPEHAALWSYMPSGPFREKTAFEDFITVRVASRDPFFYTILDRAHGKALGFCSLMRIDTAHRVVEIGNIVFSPALQRTTSATEAFCLIARAVFEDLGFRRFEWKCDSANVPSRRAAERFGFSYEGLFRQHMIVKGRNRDTAWFSIIDSEWPALRDALEKWLDPRNFDAEGNQRRSLGSFRS
jgi:RimJ/RimL family protein N-acetyltransferase